MKKYIIMIKSLYYFIDRNIKFVALSSIFIWIICQLVTIIYYWGEPQFFDSENYQKLAWECFNNNAWYPTAGHIDTEKYIFNPGYVNWLILHLHAFHTLKVVPLTNVLFNGLLLFSIVNIANRYFNKKVGYYVTFLYCMMYSNIAISAVLLTDLLFTSLTYFSILLIRKSNKFLFVSGIIIILANYVRPLSIIFILPILIFMYLKKFDYKMYATYLGSMIMTLVLIGSFNLQINNHFFVSSTTGGYNLIMGANDDMNGMYENSVFKEGHIGYINPSDSLNVFEKDRMWKTEALSWIIDHPIEYLKMAPVKLYHLWRADDYHFVTLKGKKDYNNIWIPYLEYYGYSFFYYVSIILFLCYIICNWRKRKLMWIYLLPIIFCSCIQMLLYGDLRYHYPCMPIINLFAALFLYELKLTDKEDRIINSIIKL